MKKDVRACLVKVSAALLLLRGSTGSRWEEKQPHISHYVWKVLASLIRLLCLVCN